MKNKKISKILIGTNNRGKLREIANLLPKKVKVFSTKNFNDKKNGFILLKGDNSKAEFYQCKEHYEFSIHDKIELDYYKTKKIFYVPNPYIHKDS